MLPSLEGGACQGSAPRPWPRGLGRTLCVCTRVCACKAKPSQVSPGALFPLLWGRAAKPTHRGKKGGTCAVGATASQDKRVFFLYRLHCWI